MLARLAWLLGLRGILALVFGVLALIWPDLTVLALALLFGIYALIDGAGLLADAFRQRQDRPRRVWAVLGGLLGVAAGVVTLVWPQITALALVTLAGIWAIVTGLAEILIAVRLRRVLRGEWLLALAGAASVVAGALILARPGAGAVALGTVLGVYALLTGALFLFAAWRLRRLLAPSTSTRRPHPPGADRAA